MQGHRSLNFQGLHSHRQNAIPLTSYTASLLTRLRANAPSGERLTWLAWLWQHCFAKMAVCTPSKVFIPPHIAFKTVSEPGWACRLHQRWRDKSECFDDGSKTRDYIQSLSHSAWASFAELHKQLYTSYQALNVCQEMCLAMSSTKL